jgi:hypothetical protein
MALLSARACAGLPLDEDGESRALLAARRVTHDVLGEGGHGFAALHLLAVMDVLDGWLAVSSTELHEQWRRLFGWEVPA